MTCEHIERTKEKINNLINKMNDTNSPFYEKLGPHADWKDVKVCIKEFYERFERDGKEYEFENLCCFVSKIKEIEIFTIDKLKWGGGSLLYEHLVEIFSSLKNCNCSSNASSLYSSLESERSKLERELRDLRNEKRDKEDKLEEKVKNLEKKLEKEKRERQNDKTRYDNEKLEWEREKGQKNTNIARLEEKSRNDDTEKTDLRSQNQAKENEIGRLELRLDQRVNEIRTLENQLSNLRVSDERKDNELRQKDEEIERLKRWAGLSQEVPPHNNNRMN